MPSGRHAYLYHGGDRPFEPDACDDGQRSNLAVVVNVQTGKITRSSQAQPSFPSQGVNDTALLHHFVILDACQSSLWCRGRLLAIGSAILSSAVVYRLFAVPQVTNRESGSLIYISCMFCLSGAILMVIESFGISVRTADAGVN